MVQILILLVLGYLLGSINLSVLVTKYIGKTDIRAHGSGNAGGTNVVRVMGAKWGISVMALEILKGVILGFVARYAWPVDPLALGELGPQITGAIAVIGVMFGNMYPCCIMRNRKNLVIFAKHKRLINTTRLMANGFH